MIPQSQVNSLGLRIISHLEATQVAYQEMKRLAGSDDGSYEIAWAAFRNACIQFMLHQPFTTHTVNEHLNAEMFGMFPKDYLR